MKPGLFGRIVSLEARKQMSYRADFWIHAVLGFASEAAIAYFLWTAIFHAVGASEIGGFTFQGMVLYYVAVILIGKLVRGNERDLSIAKDIYEGSLTRYLIYPSSYVWFKYAEHLGGLLPAMVQGILFGALAAWWIDVPATVSIDAGSVARAAAMIFLANVLSFLMRFPLQGVAFWADNVWSLNVMLRLATELFGGFLLPLSLFPETAQKILDLLPFAYLFYYPVQTLLGKTTHEEWLTAMGIMGIWCLIVAALGAWIWARGHRVYTGVGI